MEGRAKKGFPTSPWACLTAPDICGRCLYACCCTSCAVGDVSEASALEDPEAWYNGCSSHFVCCLLPVVGALCACQQRLQLREKLAREYDVWDVDKSRGLLVCCCAPCALAQELTEIARRYEAMPDRGAFVTSRFACFEHPQLCIYATCCTSLAVGDVAAAVMGEGDRERACQKHWVCDNFCGPLGTVVACSQRNLLREVIRLDYGITRDDCSVLFVCFCAACALTQELAEIKLRKSRAAAEGPELEATGAGRGTVSNPLSSGDREEGLGGPY